MAVPISPTSDPLLNSEEHESFLCDVIAQTASGILESTPYPIPESGLVRTEKCLAKTDPAWEPMGFDYYSDETNRRLGLTLPLPQT